MAESKDRSDENTPWPEEIRLKDKGRWLVVRFDDGTEARLSAEYLRVESPSAEVRGHGGDEKQIVPGKRDVRIIDVEPVGNYAVRLDFDDLHNTGLYSWSYLYRLWHLRSQIWNAYLEALEERGLSRDRS